MAGDDHGGGLGFRVQPEVLRAYAATLRAQSGALRDVGAALQAITVDRGWFGKLPQSGHLADGYETHHQADVAVTEDLLTLLLDVATALVATGDRYSTADGAAAGTFHAVRTDTRDAPAGRVPLAKVLR